MKTIFFSLIMLGIIAALVNGEPQLVMTALVESANAAVTRSFTLLGILSAWLGLAKIAEKSGFLNPVVKSCIRLRLLFPASPGPPRGLHLHERQRQLFRVYATPFGLKGEELQN